MTEDADLSKIPQSIAKPKKRMRFSVVWIIPIVAAIVGLGIAIQQVLSKGPMITIVFKNAEGIEAGKTFLKYKDVNIGRVEAVKLSRDFSKVVVKARIDKSAEGLIVEDAKFWIEQPRVTLSGITGISTLLKGIHIGLAVGKSTKARREFVGLEAPPAITIDQPGREFILQANNLESVGIGSPVYYRRINVGRVIGYNLARDGKSIIVNVFVNAPYDQYVNIQTRFWQASGIDIQVGANGMSMRTQSLLSLFVGGIAFETPPGEPSDLTPAAENTSFILYNDHATAMTRHEDIVSYYVLYFNDSLRGLSVGAPVTFFGLPVGEVTKVGLEYDIKDKNARPRVDIAIYPARFLDYVKDSTAAELRKRTEDARHTMIQKLIDRGLRAQLRSGNLVTGQLYVALEIFPNAPKAKVDWTKTPYELPVMPGSLQELETKLSRIITRIDKLPIEDIGKNAEQTLAALHQTMKDADTMLKHISKDTLPEIRAAAQELRKAIKTAESTLANVDKSIGKGAPAQQELRTALQEVARAARSISELAEYLERNPNALIRGKVQETPK